MLTLHMRIVQHEVHGFLVSESTTTYASVNKRIWEPNKRAVLSEALASNAFPADLAAKTNVTRLSVGSIRSFCSGHSLPGSQGCYEAGHYYGLYKLLLRVAAPGDLAYLSDVDEVASPHALRMLRQCAPFYGDDGPGGGSAWSSGMLSGHHFEEPPMYVLRAWELKYGVHCWAGSSPADQPSWILGPHVFSVSFLMEYADRIGPMQFRDTRLKMQGTFPNVVEGGWHLTSWGTSADLVTKLTSWGHADMFENTRRHPGLLDPQRLSRCMANCLSPLGYLEPPFALPPKQRHHWTLAQAIAAKNGTGRPAPPCHDRNGPLEIQLRGVRLRETDLANPTIRQHYPTYLLQPRARAEFPAFFKYLR